MSRPTIKTGPANRSADKSVETIFEVHSGVPNGLGGLISVRRADDGKLRIELYALDEGIEVYVSEERTPR